ncbi:MAG: hypothetical protein R3Y56_01785 [Akkermansia sp.]
MSEPNSPTLKSLAKLLRAFKGMSMEEYQCLEFPYSCLIWSEGKEWNVELVLSEQEDDALRLAFSAQEMVAASWVKLFYRQLEVNRSLRIKQSPVTAELALSPQVQSLLKQYKDMRESYQRFLIRITYAIEQQEEAWHLAAETESEFELQGLNRLQELVSLTLAHHDHMQELGQNYRQLSKTSGLAPRLPSIEEEGQRQTLSIKLKQFIAGDIVKQSNFNTSSCQQVLEALRLSL